MMELDIPYRILDHWLCASFRYKDCLNSPHREEAMRLVLVEATESNERSDSAPSTSTEVENAEHNQVEENSTESPRYFFMLLF